MRLKKLGAALVIVAALGAVLASSALAAATTTDVKWYTGASPGTELTGSKAAAAEQVGTGTFETIVSETEIVLHMTGTECVECKIENSGGTAVGSGKLKFTGVTVEKPAKCTAASSITTKALSVSADWMIGTSNFIRFIPAAGEETGFVSFELTGAECPLGTTVVAKGPVFVKSVNATGTQASKQEVNSSFAINNEAGANFHVGEQPACLAATTKISIEGGAAFGTH